MNITLVEYQDKYENQCISLMKATWDFNDFFKGIKDKEIIYKLFIKMCSLESSYLTVALDDQERVVGFLFSGRKEDRSVFALTRCYTEIFFLLLRGSFGARIHAAKAFSNFFKDQERVMCDRDNFDSTINLFFVSSEVRGLGIGKFLLKDLFLKLKEDGIKNTILLTDETCNYGFYDHYGFKRHRTIESLGYKGKKINIFAYTYDLSSFKGEV